MTLLEAQKESEKTTILELVRQWGGSSTDAVLDKSIRIFQTPIVEGFIGYRLESQCAIAFGDPVCNPKDWEKLAREFDRFQQSQGNHIIYIGASKAFSDFALQNVCKASIEFGQELIFDPAKDPREWTGDNGSLVRRKVRHAIHEGVEVQEYQGSNPELEKRLEHIGQKWLESRTGPQIHISQIGLFENRIGKRWLYAKHKDKVFGVITLNQLKAQNGWLINHLMITPEAPHGTSELLFVSALEILKNEGYRYATVGAVPADRLGRIKGLGKFSSWVSQVSFAIAKKFFNLSGKSKFWEKFHPQGMGTYLLFGSNKIGIREILGILRATNSKF